MKKSREAVQLSRDPFARETLMRTVAGKPGECGWCGRHGRQFHYFVAPDSGRGRPDKKSFCGIGCWRSFNNL